MASLPAVILAGLRQDLGYAWRTMSASKGYFLFAVVALALGVGANTAIFSVIHTVVLSPVPFPDPDRLVWLTVGNPMPGEAESLPADFADWPVTKRFFDGIGGAGFENFNIADSDQPERVRSSSVTRQFFSVLRVSPLLGRTLEAEDHLAARRHVVVMGYALWQRRYGGDRGVLGRSIRINAEQYTVVGIMPRGFEFPNSGLSGSELWAPLPLDGAAPSEAMRLRQGLMLVGRLRAGLTPESVRGMIAPLRQRGKKPGTEPSGPFASMVSLAQAVGGSDRTLWTLLAAVACVLLIACANVANLLLARSLGRRREMAIRAAVGASRGRLVRQLLTESLFLAAVSALLGIGFALVAQRFLTTLVPVIIIGQRELTLSGVVLAFTIGLSLLTTILFGLTPALAASRVDLREAMSDAAGSPGGRGRARLRSALVIGQVALTTLLLVGATSLARNVVELLAVEPGFRAERLLTMRLTLPTARYDTPAKLVLFYDQLFERLSAVPGVELAGGASTGPLRDPQRRGYSVIGRPRPDSGVEGSMMYTSVSPRYFETVGIRIEAGRGLSEQDRTGAIAVAVLNAAAVRQIFPGENPIGHTLWLPKGTRPGESERLLQVVGVVSDTRQFGPLGDLPGQIYVPYRQASPQRMDLVIRAQGDPAALVSSVRTATSSIDRDQPVYNIATMEGLLAETVEGLRFHMFLVGSLAATALLLALIGITGVVTFIVNLRQHEVAMRMALGAQHGDILRLFARYATFLVASGLLAGTLVSLGAGRVAVHVFYGANIADPVAIALALPVLAVAIWVVALLPARRASRVDLMKVLRQV